MTAQLPGQHAGRFVKFAQALRENPNAWAKLPNEYSTDTSAKAAALSIRNGKLKGFEPKGTFTTAVDGMTVYVQYVGPPDDPA